MSDFALSDVAELIANNSDLVDFRSAENAVDSECFGEKFYFDYSQLKDEECPIFQKLPSGNSLHYANNFYEFLCKRIEAHLN